MSDRRQEVYGFGRRSIVDIVVDVDQAVQLVRGHDEPGVDHAQPNVSPNVIAEAPGIERFQVDWDSFCHDSFSQCLTSA